MKKMFNIIIIKEMEIKPKRYYFPSTGRAIIKKSYVSARTWRNWSPHTWLGGMLNDATAMENWQFLKGLNKFFWKYNQEK